ncbi:hypothetical protein NP233_g6763 [Leucocoprinus birnbaumii]|uniref:Uncharacterized protein n=1 Tax=Leucocoprinus birnbaumii TaxID=56174 RepID=A0AAD5VT91_9AGAR|nr:hypothetical protein NP233_g6763 [Leucocoprinus birnbaumii]
MVRGRWRLLPLLMVEKKGGNVAVCLLINYENVAIGSAFKVSLESDDENEDLREEIKPNDLEGVEAHISQWKLCNPRPTREMTPGFLRTIRLIYQPPGNMDKKRALFSFTREQNANAEAVMEFGLTPSHNSKPANFRSHQQKAPVYSERLPDRTGPPIGLFHPVFSEFERSLEGNEPIPLRVRVAVQELSRLGTDIYNEEERLDKIKTALDKLVGGQLMVAASRKVQSGGNDTFT